jgi:Family of unknown function (DUF6847)
LKLAEALANRADLQRRVEQMRGRLQRSALVQEGESPPEDPQELLEEMERLVSELEEYVRRINRTNLSATLSGGETTLTDALARRDALTLRYGNLNTLVSAASDRVPRYGRAEIRILSAVEVGPLRRRMDELARERRELDISIQQANWATDLMEV